jgi:hypothetical protein
MLCLSDSIRYDDPSLQCMLHTVEEAHTLTELLVTVWLLARGPGHALGGEHWQIRL